MEPVTHLKCKLEPTRDSSPALLAWWWWWCIFSTKKQSQGRNETAFFLVKKESKLILQKQRGVLLEITNACERRKLSENNLGGIYVVKTKQGVKEQQDVNILFAKR